MGGLIPIPILCRLHFVARNEIVTVLDSAPWNPNERIRQNFDRVCVFSIRNKTVDLPSSTLTRCEPAIREATRSGPYAGVFAKILRYPCERSAAEELKAFFSHV